MPEGGEGYIPPVTKIEALKPQETLKNQHFDYTVVFGQGPVQEFDIEPGIGRKGLNFYSRMEAMAAAQMLKQGVTDKLIITGGKTGLLKEFPNLGQSEAELMADIIKREIGVDQDGYFLNPEGLKVKFTDVALLETESSDTLANFKNVINKYVDIEGNKLDTKKMALLGIGFHAYSGQKLAIGDSEISRLQALSNIFNLHSPVFSAEDVLRELALTKYKSEAVQNILNRLTNLSETHEVSQLKSVQESELVNMLKESDWLRVLDQFNDPSRIKQILANQPEVLKEFGLTKEEIETTDVGILKQKAREVFAKIKPTQTRYPQVKQEVFDRLKEMGTVDENGEKIDYTKADDLREKPPLKEVNILATFGKV